MAEENLDFNIEQLPFSLEAEQSVLGAILIEPECISRVLELLVPESFYRPQHQQLFSIMLGMFKRTMTLLKCCFAKAIVSLSASVSIRL